MNKPFLGITLLSTITALSAVAEEQVKYVPVYQSTSFTQAAKSAAGGLELILEGFYWTTANADFDYAYKADVSNNYSLQVHTVKPKFEPGFRIGIGLALPNSPYSENDLRFLWTHLRKVDTDSVRAGDYQAIMPVYDTNLATFANFTQGSGKVSTRYDAIDIEFGQHNNTPTNLYLHPFVGVRYVDSRSNTVNVVTNPTAAFNDLASSVSQSDSRLRAIGSRVGIDSAFYLDRDNHFSLTGQAAVGLLVGQVDSSQSITNLDGNANLGNGANLVNNKANRLVPNLEGRVGLGYTHDFASTKSKFKLEAGYQATHYLNAVDRYTVSADVHAGTMAFVKRNTSDLSFHGPYVSVGIKF